MHILLEMKGVSLKHKMVALNAFLHAVGGFTERRRREGAVGFTAPAFSKRWRVRFGNDPGENAAAIKAANPAHFFLDGSLARLGQ
jgi:hypothetical protein